MIQKLDGFTADGFGNVIGTEQDLVAEDVMRITDNAGISETRYYPRPAPQPVPEPIPADEVKNKILAALAALNQAIQDL